jgi:hypothetical protein
MDQLLSIPASIFSGSTRLFGSGPCPSERKYVRGRSFRQIDVQQRMQVNSIIRRRTDGRTVPAHLLCSDPPLEFLFVTGLVGCEQERIEPPLLIHERARRSIGQTALARLQASTTSADRCTVTSKRSARTVLPA